MADNGRHHGRRIRLGWLAAAMPVACCMLILLVWGLAGHLVHGDAHRPGSVVVVLPFGASHADRLDAVARLVRDGLANTVVLARAPVSFTEQVGAQPVASEVARKELIQRGVAEAAIEFLDTQTSEDRLVVRAVIPWLRQHPNRRVTLVGRPFQCAYLRYVVDHDCSEPLRGQIDVWGAAPGAITLDNWWRGSAGIKTVLDEGLRWWHLRFCSYHLEQPAETPGAYYQEYLPWSKSQPLHR